jgi:hypothetical protein
MARSLEIKRVSREISTLALAEMNQHGQLNVRQKEQLRRALTTAGDELGWIDIETKSGDPMVEINKAVLRMARNGAKAMAKDLAEQLAAKKKETRALEKMKLALMKLGEDPNTEYPVILSYDYTARDSSQNPITKTENLELNEASEAISASEGMERSTNSRTKLTDLMIVRLKEQQVRLDEMTALLPEFVKSTHPVIEAVLLILV